MPPATKASVLKGKAKLPSDTSTTKTLTPQRKHRKLLKDGSSEVWPESVEKIFVEGEFKFNSLCESCSVPAKVSEVIGKVHGQLIPEVVVAGGISSLWISCKNGVSLGQRSK
jgi:hypothetical protein